MLVRVRVKQVVVVTVDIDSAVAAKLRAKHNVMPWEVREAVVMTPSSEGKLGP